jgi:chitodextrinase
VAPDGAPRTVDIVHHGCVSAHGGLPCTQSEVRMRTRPHRWFVTPLLAAALVVGVAGPAAAAGPDTEKPSTPTSLAVAAITETSLRLTWDASTDNVGVTSYSVYRQITDVVYEYETPTNSLIIDSNLYPSQTYTFTVSALDAAGNYSGSARLVVTMPPGDAESPTAPTDVRVDPGIDGATVTWTPSTDNIYVDHYEVVSRTQGDTVVGKTHGIPASDRELYVENLTPATAYTFAVRAVDAAGNVSPLSEPVSFRTLPEQNCAVRYRVAGRWRGGFLARVTVRNPYPTVIPSWTVAWAYADGQRITSVRHADLVNAGPDAVAVRNPADRPAIAAGGAATFDLIGATGGRAHPAPTAFTVNGASCSTE